MKNEEKQNKISILIPVRNEEDKIANCLLSVIKQEANDNNPCEIIVVDNGSSDNTKDIVLSLAHNYPQIIYIFEPKKGRGQARATALSRASGDIIAMIDADCIAPNNWLKTLTLPIILGKEKAVMGFQSDAVNNYWSKMRQEEDESFLHKKTNGEYIEHLDTKNFAMEGEILRKLGFDERFSNYEDWDLFINAKKNGIKIKFLPDLRVAHYHDASCLKLIKTQFTRGREAALICRKWKNDKDFIKNFQNDPSASSSKLRNFLLFLPWSLWQILSAPKKAPFKITADAAWKLGIITAKFKVLNKNL